MKMTEANSAASRIRTGVVFAAILACLILVDARPASAVAPSVLRSLTNQTFTGLCCSSFNETVGITEPSTVRAVVIVWDTAYSPGLNDETLAGLSVNGGTCKTGVYGSDVMPAYDLANDPGAFIRHITFQWVILPGDGVLKVGANTFELCGGGASSGSDSVTLYNNTVSAPFVP